MCPCGQNDNDFAMAVWLSALVLLPIMVAWRQWPRSGWRMRAALVLVCGAVLAGGAAFSYFHAHSQDSAGVCSVATELSDLRPADVPSSQPRALTRPASAPVQAEPAVNAPSPPIVVYYFHRTIRCESCLRIEEWAKQAIDSRFADELANGLIEWRAVNIDQPATRHFEKDFGLTAQSLVLARLEGDKTVEWKNLAAVWDLLGDRGRFTQYVQDELSSLIEKCAAMKR